MDLYGYQHASFRRILNNENYQKKKWILKFVSFINLCDNWWTCFMIKIKVKIFK